MRLGGPVLALSGVPLFCGHDGASCQKDNQGGVCQTDPLQWPEDCEVCVVEVVVEGRKVGHWVGLSVVLPVVVVDA